MQTVKNTVRILAYKAFNWPIDDVWIDWAIEMLEAGFDTEHLRILAGIRIPYDQVKLQMLTNKVLQELGLSDIDNDRAIKKYIGYIIDEGLAGRTTIFGTLKILKNLYEQDDILSLKDFYLLYWAKDDLEYGDVQWYWPQANRSNIDQIVVDKLILWKRENLVQ